MLAYLSNSRHKMTFSENSFGAKLAKRLDEKAQHLFGGRDFRTYKVPMRLGEDGRLYPWEPEFGPVLARLEGLIGARHKLNDIEGFSTLNKIKRDFTYVTASVNVPEGFIGRGRFYHFSIGGKQISPITRIISDAAVAIKPEKKSMLRSEFEGSMGNDLRVSKALTDVKRQYWASLPDPIRKMDETQTYLNGLMLVQRAGLEGTHLLKDGRHSHLLNYSGSFDVCGTYDVRLLKTPYKHTDNIGKRIEVELENNGIRSTATSMSENDTAALIEASMEALEGELATRFAEYALKDDVRADLSKNAHATADMSRVMTPEELREANIRLSEITGQQQQEALCQIFDRTGTNKNRGRFLLLPPKKIHTISREHHTPLALEGYEDLVAA